MTGYGAGRASTGSTEISVVVKSVNGRFFETRFHLPKEYFAFETQIKKSLGASIRRGTVDVFVHRKGSSHLKIKVNLDIANEWVRAHKQLAEALRLPIQNASLMERLSALPQIFDVRDDGGVDASEKAAFFKAFRQALAKCDGERGREGRAVRNHLKKILKQLKQVLGRIEKVREGATRELEGRLQEKLRRLGLDKQVEPARFAQELILHLDKSDITEEVERLKEHLQMCGRYLSAPAELGKKLDFYSQELLREVNTIGSKANHAPLTEQVVVAKGLIESFKEQVQNIE